MPFKSLSDFFTNADSVRRMGEQAKEAARAQYDPSILSPQLSMFRELATEGIEDEAAIARTGAIGQLFRGVDTSLAAGNQGRALAMQQQQNQAAAQGLASLESSLAQADIQARRQGQQGFAQTRTQQNQIQAQQEAAIETADLQTQAEIDRRKGALGSTIGSLAGTAAAFIPGVGPLAAAGIGAGAGALFGGGQGALTGAATGATTAIQRDMFGTQEETTPSTDFRPTADIQVPNDAPLNAGPIDMGENFDLGSFLQMDLTDNPDMQTEQAIQRNVMGDMGADYQVPRFLQPQESLGIQVLAGLREQAQQAAPAFEEATKPTLQEFIHQQNLDAASGFQNYKPSDISFEDFVNSWLGKGLYAFGSAANEFVSTYNPVINIAAIGGEHKQRVEEEYKQRYNQ